MKTYLETLTGHAKIIRVEEDLPPHLPVLIMTAPLKYNKKHSYISKNELLLNNSNSGCRWVQRFR
jgi:hypothetical protein